MATSGLSTAVLWGLVLQLPWIACLIISGLLYWRWRTSRLGLVALALTLLIIWQVAASLVPRAVIWPLQESGPELLTAEFASKLYIISLAFSFLDNVLQLALVIFLAVAFLRFMQGMAGQREYSGRNDG